MEQFLIRDIAWNARMGLMRIDSAGGIINDRSEMEFEDYLDLELSE